MIHIFADYFYRLILPLIIAFLLSSFIVDYLLVSFLKKLNLLKPKIYLKIGWVFIIFFLLKHLFYQYFIEFGGLILFVSIVLYFISLNFNKYPLFLGLLSIPICFSILSFMINNLSLSLILIVTKIMLLISFINSLGNFLGWFLLAFTFFIPGAIIGFILSKIAKTELKTKNLMRFFGILVGILILFVMIGFFVLESARPIDSDGLNVYVKGECKGYAGTKEEKKARIFEDYCRTDSFAFNAKGNITKYIKKCDGKECYLSEYIEVESLFCGARIYSCPNGCENGACLLSEEETKSECIDSDGGKDYYTKGNTTEVYLNKIENLKSSFYFPLIDDICIRDSQGVLPEHRNMLREFYCENETTGYYENYDCPNGCNNGACIK